MWPCLPNYNVFHEPINLSQSTTIPTTITNTTTAVTSSGFAVQSVERWNIILDNTAVGSVDLQAQLQISTDGTNWLDSGVPISLIAGTQGVISSGDIAPRTRVQFQLSTSTSPAPAAAYAVPVKLSGFY
jgi:hypothetical protein